MKTSTKIYHNLSCQQSLVIKIKKAWIYHSEYDRWFVSNDIAGVEKLCNGKSECSVYFHNEPLSIIQYDCVNQKHGMTTTPIDEIKQTAVFTTRSPPTTLIPIASSSGYFITNTPTQKNFTPNMTLSNLTKDSTPIIAGSVIGVFGVLALLLLLICFVVKRRKADKRKATRSGSVTNAVGQNTNVLYIVPENVSPQPGSIDDQPPAYHTLDNIPDQYHIYINDDYGIGQDLKHQHTNNCYHIHGTVARNSPQTDDYNHTDTEAVNISGEQGDNYNHISVSGRNADLATEMEDGYNHIRSTEGVRVRDIGDYNHIAGQTGGKENTGYMDDDYNHLDNSNNQTTSEEHPCGKEYRMIQRSQHKSKSENDYANIGVKEGNNGADDFEPDDTYVYS